MTDVMILFPFVSRVGLSPVDPRSVRVRVRVPPPSPASPLVFAALSVAPRALARAKDSMSSRASSSRARALGRDALALTLDMFRGARRRTNKSALDRARELVARGVIDEPAWMDAARASAPSPRPFRARKPPAIALETDHLIRGYYKREPAAAFDAIDCGTTPERGDARAHHAQKFALRQLEVMRTKKMNEREALRIVEAERDAERDAFARAAREGRPLDEGERALTAPGEGSDVEFGSEIERIQATEEAEWSARVEAARRAAGERADGAAPTAQIPRRRRGA